jgi:hypothetical protein
MVLLDTDHISILQRETGENESALGWVKTIPEFAVRPGACCHQL